MLCRTGSYTEVTGIFNHKNAPSHFGMDFRAGTFVGELFKKKVGNLCVFPGADDPYLQSPAFLSYKGTDSMERTGLPCLC